MAKSATAKLAEAVAEAAKANLLCEQATSEAWEWRRVAMGLSAPPAGMAAPAIMAPHTLTEVVTGADEAAAELSAAVAAAVVDYERPSGPEDPFDDSADDEGMEVEDDEEDSTELPAAWHFCPDNGGYFWHDDGSTQWEHPVTGQVPEALPSEGTSPAPAPPPGPSPAAQRNFAPLPPWVQQHVEVIHSPVTSEIHTRLDHLEVTRGASPLLGRAYTGGMMVPPPPARPGVPDKIPELVQLLQYNALRLL